MRELTFSKLMPVRTIQKKDIRNGRSYGNGTTLTSDYIVAHPERDDQSELGGDYGSCPVAHVLYVKRFASSIVSRCYKFRRWV
jgi:hypothetical protein